MGLLTNRGPPKWHPAHDYIKDACKAAAEYSQVCGRGWHRARGSVTI